MSGSILINALVGQLTAQSYAYTPTMAQDVVGVYDSNFFQMFPDARPIKVSLKEAAKLMKHPVESGATITDHRIILPIGISMSMVLTPETYVDTYMQVKAALLSSVVLCVQTNTGYYKNMVVAAMPHEENPAHFDTITMNISLVEVQFVQAQTSQLPDTQKPTGNKTAKAATSTEAGAATTKAKSSAAYSMVFGAS